MHFFMAMNPPTVTAQERQVRIANGRPVFYEPAKLKEAKTTISAHLEQHIPKAPLDGALELTTIWCFPPSGSHKNGEYRTTKPDTDNLQKMLKDCMTSLRYWKDDAQVVREIVEKRWSDPSGIYINIREL